MDPSDLLLIPQSRHKRRIIRLLARWLPFPKAKRIYFQKSLLQQAHAACEREDDTEDSIKNMWYTPTPVTLADIIWLIRDDGEDGILLRCQLFGSDSMISSTPLSFRAKLRRRASIQCGAHGHGPYDIHNETPINSSLFGQSFPGTIARLSADYPSTPNSEYQTPDKAAIKKIGELENELTLLRQQLAAIALKQEQMNSDILTNSSAPPPPPLGLPPPPPPPPPPPGLFSMPKTSIQDIIKKTREETNCSNKSNKKTLNGPGSVDMSEVLKGIGTVKLRSIARSPGGTPVREKPLPSDVNDVAVLISQALKKKFAACHVASPDKENSPHNGGFSPSPLKDRTPPGRHLFRTLLKRRSHSFPLRVVSVNKHD